MILERFLRFQKHLCHTMQSKIHFYSHKHNFKKAVNEWFVRLLPFFFGETKLYFVNFTFCLLLLATLTESKPSCQQQFTSYSIVPPDCMAGTAIEKHKGAEPVWGSTPADWFLLCSCAPRFSPLYDFTIPQIEMLCQAMCGFVA